MARDFSWSFCQEIFGLYQKLVEQRHLRLQMDTSRKIKDTQ